MYYNYILRISERRYFNLLDKERIRIMIYCIKLEIHKISKNEREKEKNILSRKLEIGRLGAQES